MDLNLPFNGILFCCQSTVHCGPVCLGHASSSSSMSSSSAMLGSAAGGLSDTPGWGVALDVWLVTCPKSSPEPLEVLSGWISAASSLSSSWSPSATLVMSWTAPIPESSRVAPCSLMFTKMSVELWVRELEPPPLPPPLPPLLVLGASGAGTWKTNWSTVLCKDFELQAAARSTLSAPSGAKLSVPCEVSVARSNLRLMSSLLCRGREENASARALQSRERKEFCGKNKYCKVCA